MVIANILVIDDEPQLLMDALPLYGYNIDVAYDGIQALNILTNRTNQFDLIILDIILPNMDGWQVLKAIRNDSNFESVPIMMLTGQEGEEKEVASLKSGADDYICKPYKLPTLLAHIEALLRRSKQMDKVVFPTNVKISQTSEDKISPLSSREKQILRLVAKGENNSIIAQTLSIQEVTVKTHLKNIFKKLRVSNRMQAAMLGLKLNLLE